MKSDWQTVTENKQMQQSVECSFFEALSFDADLPPPPKAFSCFNALVLRRVSLIASMIACCIATKN
jgi:hypothetical protein